MKKPGDSLGKGVVEGERKIEGLRDASPIFDERGEVVQVVQSWRDVTGRKRTEETRRRAEKLETLGILAAGIAHDLSGLVSLVTRQLESARAVMPPDSAWLTDLDVARQAAQQANGMTQALEAVVHHMPLKKHVVLMNEVCSEASKLLRHLIRPTIIQKWDITEEPLYVLASPTQIQQVLMNLAGNAGEAMPEGGTVRVDLTAVDVERDASSAAAHAGGGRYARLDVADTGTGMTQEVKGQLFEPLFTTRHDPPHAGLGLAIVHRIVQDHQGWIEVESAEGAGSTFSVFLPCQAAVRAPSASAGYLAATQEDELRAPPGTGVLVVEGDDLQRSLLATALRDAGYGVEQVTSGVEALKVIHAKAGSIHVVVAGAKLPDMTGTQFLERIQAASPDMSGLLIAEDHKDQNLAAEAEPLGYTILCKPFQARDLALSITRLLRESEE
ncbi:MAG: ATP-binding protein [Phycisphaerae bacterium]